MNPLNINTLGEARKIFCDFNAKYEHLLSEEVRSEKERSFFSISAGVVDLTSSRQADIDRLLRDPTHEEACNRLRRFFYKKAQSKGITLSTSAIIHPQLASYSDTVTNFTNNPKIEMARYTERTKRIEYLIAHGCITHTREFEHKDFPLEVMCLFVRGKIDRYQISTLLQLHEIYYSYGSHIDSRRIVKDNVLTDEFRSFMDVYNYNLQNSPYFKEVFDDKKIYEHHLRSIGLLASLLPMSEQFIYISESGKYAKVLSMQQQRELVHENKKQLAFLSTEASMRVRGSFQVDELNQYFFWPSTGLQEVIGLVLYGPENWLPVLTMLGREYKPNKWGFSIEDIARSFLRDHPYRPTAVAYPGTIPFGKVHPDHPDFGPYDKPQAELDAMHGVSTESPPYLTMQNAAKRAHDLYHRGKLVSIPAETRRIMQYVFQRVRELYHQEMIWEKAATGKIKKIIGLYWTDALWDIVDAEIYSTFFIIQNKK